MIADVRTFVAGELASQGVDGWTSDRAVVLASELATNAVVHARTTFDVELRLEPHLLWIGVVDGNPREPLASPFATDLVSGRGLHVVAGLSDDWGSDPRAGGKVVWCAIER